MHMKVLSQWLVSNGVIGHAARMATLLRAVAAVLKGGRLSLTHLGRNLPGDARVKHQIKAVDRLLGNLHLSAERDGIYRAIAHSILLGKRRPIIVVDWSDFQSGRRWVMLKAAVPVGGRAISLYERVFPISRYNSPGANREFLTALRAILPETCCPIIIADAAFRGPWFREVESCGWDWVVRVRANAKYFREETGRWCWTRSLYSEATTRPRYVGHALLARHRSHLVGLYLVRGHKVRRGRPRRRQGPRRRNETLYRRAHREPWLLATSLPHAHGSELLVTKLYATRMQIEETFRDLKSHRWGFGLCYSRCNDVRRLHAMLLLGTLATLLCWLVGYAARALQLHRHLQANTERRRDVLSVFFVGRELLRRPGDHVPSASIRRALTTIRSQIDQPLTA
jgi:hypothetical protein